MLQRLTEAIMSQSDTTAQDSAILSVVPKDWLAYTYESYSTTFHERWPVLSLPLTKDMECPLFLVTSVAMIDGWIRDEDSRFWSIQLHKHLMEQLLANLVTMTPTVPDCQPD